MQCLRQSNSSSPGSSLYDNGGTGLPSWHWHWQGVRARHPKPREWQMEFSAAAARFVALCVMACKHNISTHHTTIQEIVRVGLSNYLYNFTALRSFGRRRCCALTTSSPPSQNHSAQRVLRQTVEGGLVLVLNCAYHRRGSAHTRFLPPKKPSN